MKSKPIDQTKLAEILASTSNDLNKVSKQYELLINRNKLIKSIRNDKRTKKTR